jgi:hypothetical protein
MHTHARDNFLSTSWCIQQELRARAASSCVEPLEARLLKALAHLLVEHGEEAVSGGVHTFGEHDVATHHRHVNLLVVLTEPPLALLHHLRSNSRPTLFRKLIQ